MAPLVTGLAGVAVGLAVGAFLWRRSRASSSVPDETARLQDLDKMASIGMLTAGIAHEINTPLGAAASMHETRKRAHAKLASDDVDVDVDAEKLRRVIDDADEVIDTALERVRVLVKELRSVARKRDTEVAPFDVHEPIESALTLVRHKTKDGITVERVFGDVPEIVGHADRLSQVFLNLFVNAAQAMPDGGTLTITTRTDGANVYIDVADTGVGIDASKLDTIFEPGFTTKSVSEGTGLGLAISRHLVTQARGTLTVESRVGEGTTFTLCLPVSGRSS